MPRQPDSSPTRLEYYSAYHEPIFQTDGQFVHFTRRCDKVHLQSGYYGFATHEDDRRAYERGLQKPEDVLVAQDVGDGAYDDIMLRWIPGKIDEPCNKPLVGTARAHLETIYNEMRLLGMPLSFQGRVPLYPSSKDQKLINYRLTRYGIQKGALPELTLLSPVHHDVQVIESMAPPPPDGRSRIHPIDSVTVLTSAMSPPKPTSGTNPSHQVASAPLYAPSDSTMTSLSPLVLTEESVRPVDQLNPTENILLAQQTFHNFPSPGAAYSQFTPPNKSSCPSTTCIFEPSVTVNLDESEEFDNAGAAKDVYSKLASQKPSEGLPDELSVMSLAKGSSSELYNAQSTILPCMDCDLIANHTQQCRINEAKLSLQPVEGLSIPQLRELVDSVAKFDPGPWTSHENVPQWPSDDPKTQIKELANVIRNLNTCAECPDLHTLDDQLTVLLWSLISSSKVELLRG
ncbi:hypothetical protein SVAN01_05797 [Stagonosporopsis vannaccii]|nr:hypothetical protein SVAN01_05797 [Stagonosporopsis vannaccii]